MEFLSAFVIILIYYFYGQAHQDYKAVITIIFIPGLITGFIGALLDKNKAIIEGLRSGAIACVLSALVIFILIENAPCEGTCSDPGEISSPIIIFGWLINFLNVLSGLLAGVLVKLFAKKQTK